MNLTTGQDLVSEIKEELERVNGSPLDVRIAHNGGSLDFTLLEVFDNQESTIIDTGKGFMFLELLRALPDNSGFEDCSQEFNKVLDNQ